MLPFGFRTIEYVTAQIGSRLNFLPVDLRVGAGCFVLCDKSVVF